MGQERMPVWVPALPAARLVAFTSHLPECCLHPLPPQLWELTLSSSLRVGCTHQPVAPRFVGQCVGGRVLPRQGAFWYLAS